jgi:hypothetical protein
VIRVPSRVPNFRTFRISGIMRVFETPVLLGSNANRAET